MITSNTKRRLRRVGIFITFLALAVTVFQMYLKQDGKPTAPNISDSDIRFNDARGINKVRIDVTSKQLVNTINEFRSVIKSIDHDKIYSKDETNSGIYIFHIDENDIDLCTDAIRRTATIQSQTVMADTSLINFDEVAVKANLVSKENQFDHLSRLAIRSDAQNRTMNQLHNEILELRQKIESYKNIDKVMLYTIITGYIPTKSPVSSIKLFVLSFLKYLAILFIATVMIYYGAKLLMLLLKLLGVKDLGVLTGYGYGQYSGYKNYSGRYSGYGYGNRRKVKRIYKDKESSQNSVESHEERSTP